VVCDQWDVIVVPFPFTDQPGEKRRPALVLSKKVFNQGGRTILAMITSAAHRPWSGDTRLTDYQAAGLHVPCIARLKLFTLDNRVILKAIGRLAGADRKAVESQARANIF
jgi:mRNA interferase MazF